MAEKGACHGYVPHVVLSQDGVRLSCAVEIMREHAEGFTGGLLEACRKAF